MNFIIDRRMPSDMAEKLSQYGNVYKSCDIGRDEDVISTHPDIQIHFVTSKKAVCAQEVFEYYKEILPNNIFLYAGASQIGNTYPQNCAYNIARLDEFVICNEKYAEKSIINFYKELGKKIVHVNQGYTKCNICHIGGNAFITEDDGIYKKAELIDGLKPFLITKGSILLKGFEYGFIGGATGKFENKVLFCGSIMDKEKKKIIEFILNNNNIELIELSTQPLYDYGSILTFD